MKHAFGSVIWMPLVLAACSFPRLPDSLSKLTPAFEVTGSAHTFGRFLLPSNSTYWTFTLTQEALVRLALDPVNVNVAASIRANAKTLNSKVISVGESEVLTSRLKEGRYEVVMDFQADLNDSEEGGANTVECAFPYAYMSFAIVPLTQLSKLSKAELEGKHAGFPALDFSTALHDSTHFKLVDTSRYLDLATISTAPSELAVYVLEVREPTPEQRSLGHSGLWTLSFSVLQEFAECAGITLLLSQERVESPKSLQCVSSGECTISHRTQKNSVTLYTALGPGNYTLLALHRGMSDTEKTALKQYQGGYIPFSLDIYLEPLPVREDRFNCEAGRLPVSLNAPGLLDSTGFLSYHDNVYADIYSPRQQTHFALTQPSVLRLVTIEPIGIGVDLRVLGYRGDIVALSETIGATEGILVELEKGEYALQFVYEETWIADPRLRFCETVRVELDIMPQKAAEAYAALYELEQCRDDSRAVTALLDEQFRKLKQGGKAGFVLSPSPDTSYRLPINSISKGDEVLFQYQFSLPVSSFLYFEVLSHSALADLTVQLSLNLGQGELGNTLSLERYSRRAFHGQINSGSYSMVLKTGPGARNQGKNQSFDSDSRFKLLTKCVVFQLKIEVMPISGAKFTQLACGGVNFVLAPNTLNTVDKLGSNGANQQVFPETGLFAKHILAPDNRKSTEADSISIIVSENSILRANFASQQGGMIIVLKAEDREIARVGTKAQGSDSLFLTAGLQESKAYSLFLYFYPSDSECPVYDLNIEIRSSGSIPTVGNQQNCNETLPTNTDLVRYQTLDDPQFAMLSASSLHDRDYTYYRGKDMARFTVPFEIHTPAAVVTAHLQASFVGTGLHFYMESEENAVTATGFFASRHYIVMHALILPKGKYSLTIEETGNGLAEVCNSFLAAVLVGAEDQWTPYEELVRNRDGCGSLALPEMLNSAGGLKAGELHWHREFPLNWQYRAYRVAFTLQEASILHLSLDLLPDVRVYGHIFKATQLLLSSDAAEGIHMKLEAGAYTLELAYAPQTDMPPLRECITLWIDFQILPQSKYLQLAEGNSCSVSSALPVTLKQPGALEFQVLTEDVLDVRVKIELEEDSEVLWELSYVGALTGAMGLKLYNWQELEIAKSTSVQDFTTLAAAVPLGFYFLRIYTTLRNSELGPVCTKINLAYSTQPANAVCVASPLPARLFSEQSKPYGGPQAKDGSIHFDGVFKVPVNRSSQALLLRIGEPCFARFLFLSSTAMELILYQDTKLTTPLGYSQDTGSTGSFATELPARYEPYTLSLTFLRLAQADTCLTFQLAIEIQLLTTVKQKLVCDTTKSLLPEIRMSLSGKETKGGLNYVIKSNSKDTRKEEFEHRIEVEIRTPGRFSAFVEFDLLTTDLSMQVLKDSQALGKSSWLVLGSQLSSSVEDLQLEAGRYTLQLRQPSPTHLIQAFRETDLCFSFALSVELDAKIGDLKPESMLNVNKLISVVPNDKSDINPLEGLSIAITWEEAVHKGNKGSFVRAFYLQSVKKGKVHPASIRQDKWNPHRLELTFKKGQLSQGSCFSLHMNIKDFDLQEDDPLPEMDFVGAHQYCTSPCACNPKAGAHCSQAQECLCAAPYYGLTCEDCVPGYSFESETGECVTEACENCAGPCVNGKCVTVVQCECGEYGSCVQGKCRCKEGYTGDRCSSCEDRELAFPVCFRCEYDLPPSKLSSAEGRTVVMELDRVEKKLHLISFLLQKASNLQFTISGFLQNTKVHLTDSTGQVYTPSSDESDNGARTLKWELPSDLSFTLAIKSEPEFYCDALQMHLVISPSDSTQLCKGHGQNRAGKCMCEAGYTGLACEVCEGNSESQPIGSCIPSLLAEETNWSTAVWKGALCAVALLALCYLYSNKQQRDVYWGGSSDSDNSEEGEELEVENDAEEMALLDRNFNDSRR